MQMRSLRSIVAGRPSVTVSRDATVVDAARHMKQRNVGSVLVLDDGRLAGIFTERDALFRVLAAARDPATTTLGEVMTLAWQVAVTKVKSKKIKVKRKTPGQRRR